jgi:hypothetical protein
MVNNQDRFSPRDWVMREMSPQNATAVLDSHIGTFARAASEPWTTGKLAVKVTALDAMSYWDEENRALFDSDYEFLRSTLK